MQHDDCNPFVIDDDADFRLLLARAFTRAGVSSQRIREARNGIEAIELLRQVTPGSKSALHPEPSVIILDLNLPGLSGLDVLSWIRNDPTLKDAFVFMLTSSEQPEDVSRAYELGVDSYFVKPRDFGELKKIADRILTYRRVPTVRMPESSSAPSP
jgi:CheY-like chemotaxis protein